MASRSIVVGIVYVCAAVVGCGSTAANGVGTPPEDASTEGAPASGDGATSPDGSAPCVPAPAGTPTISTPGCPTTFDTNAFEGRCTTGQTCGPYGDCVQTEGHAWIARCVGGSWSFSQTCAQTDDGPPTYCGPFACGDTTCAPNAFCVFVGGGIGTDGGAPGPGTGTCSDSPDAGPECSRVPWTRKITCVRG